MTGKRGPRGPSMAGASKRQLLEEIVVPVYSYGRCQGKTLFNQPCRVLGDLGDGLCQDCWDSAWSIRIAQIRKHKEKKR